MLNRSTFGFPFTILMPAMTTPYCFHDSLVAKQQPIMMKFPLSGFTNNIYDSK